MSWLYEWVDQNMAPRPWTGVAGYRAMERQTLFVLMPFNIFVSWAIRLVNWVRGYGAPVEIGSEEPWYAMAVNLTKTVEGGVKTVLLLATNHAATEEEALGKFMKKAHEDYPEHTIAKPLCIRLTK